jgi:hypothetical protein
LSFFILLTYYNKIKGKEYVLNTDFTILQLKEICELCEIKYLIR